jgi:hypothetical protein
MFLATISPIAVVVGGRSAPSAFNLYLFSRGRFVRMAG